MSEKMAVSNGCDCQMCTNLAALRTKLAEARKDSERLDFISVPSNRIQWLNETPSRWTVFGQRFAPYGWTLREAIDSARASVKGDNP